MNFYRLSQGLSILLFLTLLGFSPALAQAKTTLVFWSHDNPEWVAGYKTLIASFEKAHPQISIKYQVFTYDGLRAKLTTTLGTSGAPDVFNPFGTWVTAYARAGKLDPVPSSVMSTEDIKRIYFPASTGALLHQDKYYGLPREYNLENNAMLVDPEAFKNAGLAYPKTWAELKDAAARLTVRQGNTIKRAGFLFTSTDNTTFLLLALILQQGASYWAADGIHIDLSTPAAINAMVELKSFADAGVFSERDFPVGTLDISDYFFRRQAAMAYRGPWVVGVGLNNYKNVKFDYVAVPSFTNQPPRFAAESGWADVVSATSRQKEAAWTFVKYIHNKENSRTWNLTTYTVPARRDLVNDAILLKAQPHMKTIAGFLQYGQWVGPVQDRDKLWVSVNRYASKIFSGQVGVEQGLKQAQDEINKMIDQQRGAGQ